LADSTYPVRLRHLDLSENPRIGASGVGRLARSPAFAAVESLKLADVGLRGEGVEQLLAGPLLEQLRELDLSGNDLGAVGAGVLASARLDRLQRLRLRGCRLGSAGLQELLRGLPAGLEVLDLWDNGLGDADAALLATAELESLKMLTAGRNPMGSVGMKILRDRFGPAVTF
jgi:Ran GTPase-activating protein (RanGAP) involved in mRNA processing and transport